MKLEHKFVVPAPVEQTWAAFNDLERVVPCFPGATLTSYEGDDFTGSCKVKLGPVSLQYNGTGTFLERDEAAHSAVIEAKGKDRRGNGTATAHVTTRLTGTADDTTEVTVDTNLTITGRPAQFGRGLMQEVSDKLLDQFTACLSTKLLGAAEQSVEDASGSGGPAPADADPGPRSPRPATSDDSSAETEPLAIDLASTVLPMLARRAAPYLIGAVLALVLRRLFRR
ncbi:MAG: SRPBCC family protein [Kribbellaceae bacterium]|nr:SRPBCC family protein [Kribbellaceae bacterium]